MKGKRKRRMGRWFSGHSAGCPNMKTYFGISRNPCQKPKYAVALSCDTGTGEVETGECLPAPQSRQKGSLVFSEQA